MSPTKWTDPDWLRIAADLDRFSDARDQDLLKPCGIRNPGAAAAVLLAHPQG